MTAFSQNYLSDLSIYPVDINHVMGIDVGVASVGIAVYRLNIQGPDAIPLLSVRCFPEAQAAADRRLHRSQGRTIRRRALRLKDLRQLLVEAGILQTTNPDDLKQKKKTAPCPWALRAKALNDVLTAEELARVLIHIAKHRGWKSNSKKDGLKNNEAPPEDQKMLSGISKNEELRAQYTTIGQMVAEDERFKNKKRNTKGDYSHTMKRDSIEEEARTIFKKQIELRNPLVNDDLRRRFFDIAFRQRPIGNSFNKVGTCPFEPKEKRAASHAYSFELFRYLSRLHTLKIALDDGKERKLSADEIRKAAAGFGDTEKISYKKLKKLAGLNPDTRFINIGDKNEKDDVVNARKTNGAAKGTNILKSVLGPSGWASLIGTPEILDEIAFTLSFWEDPKDIKQQLSELGLDDLILSILMDAVEGGIFAQFNKAGHISAKACRNMIEHLLAGHDYSNAAIACDYDPFAPNKADISTINSPVVKRSILETLKQVRAVIKHLGFRPGRIHIELAREIGKSAPERAKMTKGINKKTAQLNKDRDDFLKLVNKADCKPEEFLRYQLWKEQLERCIYTDQYLSPHDLLNDRLKAQVDHVLPRSRSFDNSYLNKVLCTIKANQDKGNKTPFEWKGRHDPDWWHDFTAKVTSLKIKGTKKRNLLMENFDEEKEGRFKNRNLVDTQFTARAIQNKLVELYHDQPTDKRYILARPGPLVALVRKAWGLEKSRSDDRHHARDALICAMINEGLLQKMTKYFQWMEAKGLKDRTPDMEPPWEIFRHDVEEALDKVLVVRTENRRARGKVHDATIHSVSTDKDNKPQAFERVRVDKNLTKAQVLRMKDADRNKPVQAAVLDWIEQGSNEDKLPLDHQGGIIRRIRIESKSKPTSGMILKANKGHVDNAEMIRTDVFEKDGKYYLVPVYPHQLFGAVPPSKACVANKPESDWTEIDQSFQFKFSLYKNSFIEVITSKNEPYQGYYRGTDRNTSAISISPHFTRSKEKSGIGARTLKLFKKFQIDRLGNKHEVRQEVRTWHGKDCT